MTRVHYFQRYSQRENVVTNNTLLLLSRLYAHSPLRLETVLQELIGDEKLRVGPVFTQQDAGQGRSIPDGALSQPSFKVAVETKLHSKPDLAQLEAHLESFGDEDVQVLLVLTPEGPGNTFKDRLKVLVQQHNAVRSTRIQAECRTFGDIVGAYSSVLAVHEYEMQEIVADYEQFCSELGLLPRARFLMRAAPCGTTLAENFRYGIYYDPADRSKRDHAYVGIYSEKRIRGIGRLENRVVADLVDGSLKVHESTTPVTESEAERIVQIIHQARSEHGWDISIGHKFFLVGRFYETEYRKDTPGPMRGAQYFDLGKILDTQELPSTERIAEQLRSLTWQRST